MEIISVTRGDDLIDAWGLSPFNKGMLAAASPLLFKPNQITKNQYEKTIQMKQLTYES